MGALDSFELLNSGKCRVVVLTEDTKVNRLQHLLEVNGFPDDQYMIQSYHGVSNIMTCAALADFFLKQGRDTYVLVHRDSDCLLPDEIEWYLDREASKLPGQCKLFFTPLTDVEHQFCQPAHIADALNMPIEQADALVADLISANAAKLAMEFSQKRTDLKAKILCNKENVPSATAMALQQVSFEQVKGKSLWGLLHQALTAQKQNPMLLLTKQTDALKIDELEKFAAMAWPSQARTEPAAADGSSKIVGISAAPIRTERAVAADVASAASPPVNPGVAEQP